MEIFAHLPFNVEALKIYIWLRKLVFARKKICAGTVSYHTKEFVNLLIGINAQAKMKKTNIMHFYALIGKLREVWVECAWLIKICPNIV